MLSGVSVTVGHPSDHLSVCPVNLQWQWGPADLLLTAIVCIDDIAFVLQQNRLRWYGHVLRKDDDWVKKCMEYEVEGPRPKETWREVVREDCQARKMNKGDAL